MSNANGKYILGVESGLAGGSVAIFSEEKCIDSRAGEKTLSRSEDLLVLIEEILAENDLQKRELASIIVSDGPGSITGVRIGLATARGLSDALAIPARRFSVLDALAVSSGRRMDLTAAVFGEKSGLHVRDYKCVDGMLSPSGAIFHERDVNGFLARLDSAAESKQNFVVHEDLEFLSKRGLNKSLKGNSYIDVVCGHYASLLATSGTSSATPGKHSPL